MASPTQWTWVWVNSGSWWWTGRPGVLQSMQSQRVRHDLATELNWKMTTAGIPCQFSGWDFLLPLQGARVPILFEKLKSCTSCSRAKNLFFYLFLMKATAFNTNELLLDLSTLIRKSLTKLLMSSKAITWLMHGIPNLSQHKGMCL